MDILYRREQATALEVLESLPDPPTYSAVRSALRILEHKGHIRHKQDGARFLFVPTMNREKAKRSAIRHLMQTFFGDSPEKAVAMLLDVSSSKLSDAELDRLTDQIEKARKGVKS